jgi:hypothetical protein
MMEFGLFTGLLGLISLVSFIWLLIVTFKQSVLWGFLVLLFSPISAIAFSVYHWDVAKKAFLVYLTTNIIFFVMVFNAFSNMGGMEMIATTQEAAEQLEKGEITEEEAAKRVAEQMQSNIKRMEEEGYIAMDERKALEEKVQELKLDDSGTTGKSQGEDGQPVVKTEHSSAEKKSDAQAAKSADSQTSVPATQEKLQAKAKQEEYEFGPNWSLESALQKKREKYREQQLDLPSPKPEGEYIPVPVSRAEQFVGRQVRVIREKTRHDGLLKAANDNNIILDMQVSGGQAQFEIKRYEIQSMYLLTFPDGQKTSR